MKNFKQLCLYISVCLMFTSCEDYLSVAPEAEIKEEDIFQDFQDFQGFVDDIYLDIVNISKFRDRAAWNWADDTVMGQHWIFDARMDRADYNYNRWGPMMTSPQGAAGYYENSWEGIRKANIVLSHLDDLVGATQEERDLLEGQAYFFRGFFHFELMRFYGGLPYVDQVLDPESDLKIPRLNYHETAEKVELDLDRAIALLPVHWDYTEVGDPLKFGTINDGRVTKGAALGIKLMNLQYAASPLMNGSVNNDFSYNTDYAKRASDVGWELIKLAEANTDQYLLEDWATYGDMFTKFGGELVSIKEWVWGPPMKNKNGVVTPWRGYGRQVIAALGGDAPSSPTANYVDLFETNTGYPIDDAASGYDPKNPWENRDPRFDFNIRTDREVQTIKSGGNAANHHIAQLYNNGRHRGGINSLTGFICSKFAPPGLDKDFDRKLWGNLTSLEVPYLRLSEVYLIYAEMVNEAYGPNGSAPGANYTAVQAVNKIRTRAGQADVPSKFTASAELFRQRVWNERNVELAFEHKRWFDIRRWYIAHLPKQKEQYVLNFDKGHTFFEQELHSTRVFELKHYWWPFPNKQVALYDGFFQNPGW